MKPRQQVSRAAIDLIKRFEGYRRASAQLEDRRWTIGYGHTKTARPGVEVSEADAEALLLYDLMEIAGVLNEWIYTPLTQNQFDALAAFVFNIGPENFRRSSVLRRLNEGALLQAACGMEMWRKADFEGERIVIDALVRRRAAEKLLFLTPTNGFLPAPTPILAPRIDHDVAGSIPSQAPVELKAQMHGDRAIAERIGPIGVLRPSPPEEDESPSRTQVAAAEITARLQSILTESEPDAAAPIAAPSPPAPDAASDLDQPPAPPEADAAPDFNLTPPPAEQEPLRLQPEMEARPESMPEPEPELFTAEPMRFAEFTSERSSAGGFDEFAELENAPVEPVKAFGGLPLLLGLAILGLIVFTGALFFGFSARPHDGLFSLPNLIVGGLGLTGIGCVATAVYFIFERLGGREDE